MSCLTVSRLACSSCLAWIEASLFVSRMLTRALVVAISLEFISTRAEMSEIEDRMFASKFLIALSKCSLKDLVRISMGGVGLVRGAVGEDGMFGRGSDEDI